MSTFSSFHFDTDFDYSFLRMKVNMRDELMSKCSKVQSGTKLILKVV